MRTQEGAGFVSSTSSATFGGKQWGAPGHHRGALHTASPGTPPRPAGPGGSARAGPGLRGKGGLPSFPRGSAPPQPPPRPGAGQGGIPGRRSNRRPAAAPEPAGRAGNGSPEGHHRRGRVAREPGGATPHPTTSGSPPQGAASVQTLRPPTRRWQRGNMT